MCVQATLHYFRQLLLGSTLKNGGLKTVALLSYHKEGTPIKNSIETSNPPHL